ncbi:hypothetical protein EAO71_37135 [Streptomyces sp. ms191]|nr:hypothetical protein EAO71_37135 [Streptomyces sp. ms191]
MLGIRKGALALGDGAIRLRDPLLHGQNLRASLDAGLVCSLRVHRQSLRLASLLDEVQASPVSGNRQAFQLVGGRAGLGLSGTKLLFCLLEPSDCLAFVQVRLGEALVHVLQRAGGLAAGVSQLALDLVRFALGVHEVPLGIGDLLLCFHHALGCLHARVREGSLSVGQASLRGFHRSGCRGR